MSEYQYVAFRAIDAPVTSKNLTFMRKQSSRAQINSWSFKNEYQFGDFHGDALEMLRRGYDFHFHYADFGIRKLMIRLPTGLPDAKAAEPYIVEDSSYFLKDKQGPGGILCFEPYFEPGDLDDLFDPDDLLDRLLPLRAEILDGDLRPLYLAHLAIASDRNHDPDQEKDAPVPAGLNKLTDAQLALSEFFGLDESLIAAAARNSPPLLNRSKNQEHHAEWLKRQPDATKIAWLSHLMDDPGAPVRREILAEYKKSQPMPSWPNIRVDRTIGQLKLAADEIKFERDRQRAHEAGRKRAKKLADMARDPTPTLLETEELVKQRSLDAYHRVALLLADLREALSGTDRRGLAETHAHNLKEKNPNLRHLTAALRGQAFLKG
jgi:hypothetical protein